ncbi:hypothetical protein [Escherichia coli]|uniref:hypothetical protein n=1 Tax=Escherichia coli TaxID=562 RepID=UPI00098C2ACE|nr:hypothetical protein [Escherichia coli]
MLLRKFWHNERAGIVVISLKLLAQSIRSHLTMPVLFSGDSSGLKDKWCISNVSLDNALLAGKFIEIIMLIKLVVIFLLA